MTKEHKKRFNEQASKYNTERCHGRAQCIRKVLELLDPKPNDVILDLGCGPGTQLIELSRSIKYGYGIDLADEMIRRAKAEATGHTNLNFSVGTAQHIPDSIFTVGINKIFSNYALHHLSDSDKHSTIMRLSDLLPAGGLFVLGDLMFSENPENHQDSFEFVGYGPGDDTPSYVSTIEQIFTSAGLKPTTYILNPLVGVVAGLKTQQIIQPERQQPFPVNS
jgi:trans-aconitate methyltransferase